MKRYFSRYLVLYLLPFTTSPIFAQIDSAYLFLNELMDRYSNTFDVYTDRDAGGNHFIPSAQFPFPVSMLVDDNWKDNPYSGCSCIRIQPLLNINVGWTSMMWEEPEGFVSNPTNYNGYNLTGATKLSFWARADEPGMGFKALIGFQDVNSEVSDPTNPEV